MVQADEAGCCVCLTTIPFSLAPENRVVKLSMIVRYPVDEAVCLLPSPLSCVNSQLVFPFW